MGLFGKKPQATEEPAGEHYNAMVDRELKEARDRYRAERQANKKGGDE